MIQLLRDMSVETIPAILLEISGPCTRKNLSGFTHGHYKPWERQITMVLLGCSQSVGQQYVHAELTPVENKKENKTTRSVF